MEIVIRIKKGGKYCLDDNDRECPCKNNDYNDGESCNKFQFPLQTTWINGRYIGIRCPQCLALDKKGGAHYENSYRDNR